ncbi:hypothetical protein LTR37_014284 [Vermiconidia calcicola]|uniref:Uncharacterized protein n=1 Tax=Vermiconidia calcicola TaxID=1690605 RepID=A0ACC3MTZ8_9PEZI|nr:hypothetical protein LTR37_014284 [Vermiconidia calcicola]
MELATYAVDAPSSSEAASKKLNLPELLENILIHVDIKNLFKLQRVNKTFKATIARSKEIQRKMFLLGDPSKGRDLLDEGVFNPLLATIPGCQFWYATSQNNLADCKFAVDVEGFEYKRTRARVEQGEVDTSWLKTLLLASYRSLHVLVWYRLDLGSTYSLSCSTIDPGATLASLFDNINRTLDANGGIAVTRGDWDRWMHEPAWQRL